MALPFLPEAEITPMFDRLKATATTRPLKQFIAYVPSTWITSTIWPPSTWCVFMMTVRTNNDIEGWHHALNRRACGRWDMPLYLLNELLHREARLSALHVRLVSEKKLKRIQRKQYRSIQSQIFVNWQEYTDGNKSVEQLLKACAHVNGPVIIQ